MGEPGMGRGALDGGVLQSARVPDCVPAHAASGARGARVGGSQQRDGGDQDRGDPDVHAGEAGELDSVCALGVRRDCDRGGDRLLYVYRIRFSLDGGGGVPTAAAGPAVRDHCVAGDLHAAVRGRGGGAAGDDEVHDVRLGGGGRGPGGVRAESAGGASLLPLGDRGGRADGDDFIAAGLSVRASAHLVCDVARRAAAEAVLGGTPEIQNAALVDLDRLFCGGNSGGGGGHRGCGGLVEHRHAVRVHAGVAGGDPVAAATARPAAGVSSTAGAVVPADLGGVVRGPDDRADGDHLDPLCGVAGDRADDLFLLQPAPQRVCAGEKLGRFLHFEATLNGEDTGSRGTAGG